MPVSSLTVPAMFPSQMFSTFNFAILFPTQHQLSDPDSQELESPFSKKIYYLMCIHVLPICMSVHHMCVMPLDARK